MILGEAHRYITELKQQNDEMLLNGPDMVQGKMCFGQPLHGPFSLHSLAVDFLHRLSYCDVTNSLLTLVVVQRKK